jgi:DNA (cytosine-5)-methyltransferase 1
VRPTLGSLFTGYGGLDLAVVDVLDADLRWVCDNDPAAAAILTHRHPDTPNLGDITAVDWTKVEPVDVVAGGFPCQDISKAGKGAGLAPGTRSGLWVNMADAIDQLRPALVVIENVRAILSAKAHCDVEPCPFCMGDERHPPLRAFGAVLGDLADLGFHARWTVVRASDVGAPHQRQRCFIVATHPGRQRHG